VLVENIGIPFDFVSTDLDAINEYSPYWWNMGKFYTYADQRKPFIHIDNDVFIWDPLPERILSAPLFSQNPEYFTELSDYYRPVELETALTNCWLPDEWIWGRKVFRSFQKAFNTGIYGGYRTDFIRYCANLAINIVSHPDNIDRLASLDDKAKIIGMIEMYLPSVCCDFHRGNGETRFRDIFAEHLFSCAEEAYNNPRRIKYTHIIGRAKRDLFIIGRLEDRVRVHYPHYYQRIEQYLEDSRP
jgi:hypothetical protein